MSKYINRLGQWFRSRKNSTPRDISVSGVDANIPPLLETYNRHRDNSAAQILAGTGIMH
jgi:hypothetical protein